MTGPPAPRPCSSCPYRRDVPSGIWHPDEYRKLPAYDRPTPEQPLNLFLCHQTGADDPGSRLCAGWVGCHGSELLALRYAAVRGALEPEAIVAVLDYRTPTPLFASGTEAAAHGMRAVERPDRYARNTIRKISQRRGIT